LAIGLNKFNPPFLVHTDIFRTAHLVRKQRGINRNLSQIFRAHVSYLENYFGAGNLIFPTFNYDFPKTQLFDVEKTDSQVGSLTNYVRSLDNFYRTRTPIFSFAVSELMAKTYSNMPFGKGSLFDDLYEGDGTIVFYGTGINTCTYLHFVESQIGPPRYRYDKTFNGTLISNGARMECEVFLHVRPLGINWGYDWSELERTLSNAGAIISLGCNIFAVKARNLSEIWGDRIRVDDLSILSDDCRLEISRRLTNLGRRFILSDFEAVK